MAMTSSAIDYKDLQGGIDTCLKQSEVLLASGNLLFENERYPTSLAMSILAIEESAKVRFMLRKRDKHSGMTSEEWQTLAHGKKAHSIKLGYEYEWSKEAFNKEISKLQYYYQLLPLLLELGPDKKGVPSYEKMQEIDPMEIQRLKALDRVKQDCLYTDWNGNQWVNFTKRYRKNQQEAVALVELNRAAYLYWSNYRWNKYPQIGAFGTPDYEKFISDISTQKITELGKLLNTAGYKKKGAIWRLVMKEYIESKTKAKSSAP